MKILSMKTTIFLGAMLSLLVCLMFTGCSNSETNSTSRGLTDFAHIEEEYLATIDSLNWLMALHFLINWKMRYRSFLSGWLWRNESFLFVGIFMDERMA